MQALCQVCQATFHADNVLSDMAHAHATLFGMSQSLVNLVAVVAALTPLQRYEPAEGLE